MQKPVHRNWHHVNHMQETANKTLFVTGTDTSVGKTYVCARLLEFLHLKGIRAGYQKWVATGVTTGMPEDLELCLTAAAITAAPDEMKQYCPYSFRLPASPHLAAEMENRTVRAETIVAHYKALAARYEWLIIEGVGGVMVPLHRKLLLIDLVASMRLTTLLVARSGLGTLNHTLLTLEALRQRRIPVLGVVFSDSETEEDEKLVQDNLRTIEKMGEVRVFGRLQRRSNIANGAHDFDSVGHAIMAALVDGVF